MAGPDTTTDLALLDPKTGKTVSVPASRALEGLREGRYQALKGASYALKTPTGSTHFVKAESLQGALASGWGIEERGKAHDYIEGDKYSGKTGLAALTGLAKGAHGAFGASSDAALAERARWSNDFRQKVDPYAGTYVESAQDRMRGTLGGMEKYNGSAHTAGELAGFALSAGATGGGLAGGAGSIFRDLGMGARAASIGGMALEGAFVSRADAMSSAALENRQLSGEELATSMGLGALMGGGMGGMFEAAGAAASGLKSRFGGLIRNPAVLAEAEALAAREAAAGGGPRLLGAGEAELEGAAYRGAREHGGVTPAGRFGAAEATAVERTEAGRSIRQAAHEQEGIFKKASRELYDSISEAQRIGQEDAANSYGETRRGHVKRILADTKTDGAKVASTAYYDRVTQEFRPFVEEASAAEASLKEAQSAFRSAKGEAEKASARLELDMARDRMAAAQHPLLKEMGEILEHAETTKMRLGRMTDAERLLEVAETKKLLRQYGSSALAKVSKTMGPLEASTYKEASQALYSLSQEASKLAENEGIFGLAGTAEREINAARSAQQSAEAVLFPSAGTTIKERGVERWMADPKKIDALLKSAADERSPQGIALKKWIEATTQLHEGIAKHYGTDTVAYRRIAERARAVGAAVDSVRANAADLEALRSMGGGNAVPSGVFDKVIAMATPGGRADMMAATERAVMAADKALGTKVADAFVAGGKGSRAHRPSPFFGGTGGVRGTTERSIQSVLDANGNPEKLAEMVHKAVGPHIQGDAAKAGPHITEVVAELTQTVIRAVGYLASQAPPGAIPDPRLAAPHLAPPSYSDGELLQWQRKAAVVDNPLLLLDHLASGRVVKDEVDAVKAVYPELYKKIEQTLLRQVVATPKMSRSLRLQLSGAFGLPMDAAYLPGRMQVLQMTPKGRAGKASGGMKAIDLGSALSKNAFSDAERLARR